MADEIEVTIRAVLNDPSGFLKNQKFDFGTTKHTQTNRLLYSDIVSVTTADTVFGIGSVGATTQGMLGLVNLDPTNYVDFGKDVAGALDPCIRLKPNKKNWLELVPSAAYRWQANTATCKVFVFLLGV